MDVARAPAVSLVEANEDVADQDRYERKREQVEMAVAAAQPPTGGGKKRQPGHCPRPEAHLLADPSLDRVFIRRAEHGARPEIPVPDQVADLIDQLTVLRKRRG